MTPRTLPGKIHKSMVAQNAILPAFRPGNLARDPAGVNAYPFFYGFVKYPYQTGVADVLTGVYSVTDNSAEGPDGLAIPAGGVLNIPIIMEKDAAFHLLYTKFGAFRVSEFTSTVAASLIGQSLGDLRVATDRIHFTDIGTNTGIDTTRDYFAVSITATTFQVSLTSGGAAVTIVGAASVVWRFVSAAVGSRDYLLYPYTVGTPNFNNALLNAGQHGARIPYWTELDVTMHVVSSGGRDLYGGFQRQPLTGVTEEAPIPMLDLQASKDGLGMVKTPYQLGKSANVNIRVTSRSAYPLRVYGYLFGYKILI